MRAASEPSAFRPALGFLAALLLVATRGSAAEKAALDPLADNPLFAEPAAAPARPATLRGLAVALAGQQRDEAAQLTWQLLAIMARAHAGGTGPSDYLGAAYRVEKLTPAESVAVQRSLLGAWSGAQSLALFTPENLALMDRGQSPRATRGAQRGQPVVFDLSPPPEAALKMRVGGKSTAPAPAPVAIEPALPSPEPAPAPLPAATPASSLVKTYEVRLHEKLPLDACGLANWELELDRVDPSQGVAFHFGPRLSNPFRSTERFESSSGSLTLEREATLPVFDVTQTIRFLPERIPGTNLLGVRLQTTRSAIFYLDGNVGTPGTYRIHVRGPR